MRHVCDLKVIAFGVASQLINDKLLAVRHQLPEFQADNSSRSSDNDAIVSGVAFFVFGESLKSSGAHVTVNVSPDSRLRGNGRAGCKNTKNGER